MLDIETIRQVLQDKEINIKCQELQINIPNEIFIKELICISEGRPSEVEKYIENYRNTINIIDTARKYTRGIMDDIEVLELVSELAKLKKVEYHTYIAESLELVEDEINKLQENVRLYYLNPSKNNEKSEAVECNINQNDLNRLMQRLENASVYDIEENRLPETDGPILILYGEGNTYFECKFNEVYKIYMTQLPIRGFIKKEKLKEGKIKYISLDESLSEVERETVKAEACYYFKPEKLSKNDISITNLKWRTLEQIKSEYDLDNVREIKRILELFDVPYEKANKTYIVDSKKFEVALEKHNLGIK